MTQHASPQQLLELMAARRSVRPKNMSDVGPDASQLALILGAAAHAPDHGRQLPWRLVQVPGSARDALAQVFVDAVLERDPDTGPELLGRAREKAYRSPALWLLIARGNASAMPEACISAGCALQNMLLVATALGLASGVTSGESLQAQCFRAFFGLGEDERAVCFLSLGTLSEKGQKPSGERPSPAQYVSTLPLSGTDIGSTKENAS